MVGSFFIVFMPNLPMAPSGVEDLLPKTEMSSAEKKALFSTLETGNPNSVAESMRKLGLQLKERVGFVVKKLKDPNPQVRSAAVLVIAHLKIKSMAHKLYAMLLHDPSPLVRGQAAQSLGEMGYSKARKAILDMLDQPDIREQLGAVRALGHLGGPRVLHALASKLQSPSPEIREAAILAMGQLKDPKVLRYIVRMLGTSQPSVKAAAIRTLASLGYKKLVNTLPKYLLSQESRISQAAIDAAITLKCTTLQCATSFKSMLSSKDPIIVANVFVANSYLNILNSEDLKNALHPPYPPEAMRRILYGGARIGLDAILPHAIKALDSKVYELKAAGLRAIRLLRPKNLPRPINDILKEMASIQHPNIRSEILLLAFEFGLQIKLPNALPLHPILLKNYLLTLPVIGNKKLLDIAISKIPISSDSYWALLKVGALMNANKIDKIAMKYIALGEDPKGIAWAALALALTGNSAYHKYLRQLAKRLGNKIPELFVAAAIGESFHKGDKLYNYLELLIKKHPNKRVALFASAALWRTAPISGEGYFTKAFDSYLMKGLNSLQKSSDFQYLKAAFTSSFAPWANRASSSKCYLVVWNSLLWSHSFRNIKLNPVKKEKDIIKVPVQIPKKPKLNLPFKVNTQMQKKGCNCSVTDHKDPSILLILLGLFLVLGTKYARQQA